MNQHEEATAEQVERAKAAGWNPEDGEPPDDWDAHGQFVDGLERSTDLSTLLDQESK